MKKFITVFDLLLVFFAAGQKNITDSAELSTTNFSGLDSLESTLSKKKEDTSKVLLLAELSFAYTFREAEKGVAYGQQGLRLADALNYKRGKALCDLNLGWSFWALGNYNAALQLAIDGLHQFETLNDNQNIAFSHILVANVYRDIGDYKRALPEAYKATELQKSGHISPRIGYANLGAIYELQNQLDSAYIYVLKAYEIDLETNGGKWDWLYYLFGNIEAKKKNYNAALRYYRTALPLAIETNIYKSIVEALNGISKVYRDVGNYDSCIYYANEVLQKWSNVAYQKGMLQTTDILAGVYKAMNQKDSAIKYLEFSANLRNKLFGQEQERDIQNMAFNEQMRRDIIERERQQYRNNLKMSILLASGIIFLVIALMFWRNNQHRKRAFLQLQQQKEQTDIQKTKAEEALDELRSTQAQLLQSEKMASLGELTAGIAHEIQNPLNFVNNFSEVNNELAEEISNENDIEEIKLIAIDLKLNSEKILFHGKRADAIVKGMLQHSKQTSGTKEPADINKLCDGYLRLSFHGLRTKDKSLNADFKTDFDESIDKINIVPQDIGRVLLNLFNNAFYATNEKSKSADENYKPLVSIRTKKINDKVEIIVSDNGNGIPQNIIDKIFQPFFTTKPTGQGTGLGLSLAYDIITKEHNGTIKVESKEGEGSEFIIQLPITA